MKDQSFTTTIAARVSASEAFEAVNNVSKWWSKNTNGETKNKGDVFTVTFGETFATFEIIEMIPDKKVVWLTKDCNLHWMKDKKEWKNTKMVFEIDAFGDDTQVKFTHVGMVPDLECFTDCCGGWTHYITKSLFKLITEQKGMPDDPNHSAIERQ